jgi:peptide/nickel transport system permease protein
MSEQTASPALLRAGFTEEAPATPRATSRAAPHAARRATRPWPRWARPRLVLPLLVLALLLACAVAPGWIAPYAPTDMDDIAILAPPDGAHWAGTDHFGRDVLSLMIYGARQSLLMGFWAVLVGGVLGGGTGLAAGYLGGRVDLLLMRLLDIWMSVPDILLAIILAAAMGAGLTNTILAVGLVLVPRFARIMRAQVLAVRGLPFVEASRAMGTAPWRIVLRHVLPHTVSQMLVMATLGLGSAILIGASLSFIGLGVIDDRPDWGFLLNQGRNYLTVAWWFATLPGLAITALVISVNLLGDALRDRLDPRRAAR